MGLDTLTANRQAQQRAEMRSSLPEGSSARKAIPLARGALDYFPAALAAVADLSRAGNEKHNPGEDLHWSRGKSNDHADCLLRHLVDRGTTDPEDGIPHSVKVAWRALALLQEELEATGAPLARGAKVESTPAPTYVEGMLLRDLGSGELVHLGSYHEDGRWWRPGAHVPAGGWWVGEAALDASYEVIG